MYGYVWLCIAKYSMAMFGYVWLHMAMYSLAIRGYVRMAMYAWLCMYFCCGSEERIRELQSHPSE